MGPGAAELGPILVLAAAVLLLGCLLVGLVLARRPWLLPWFLVVEFALSSELRLRLGGSAGALKDVLVALAVGFAVVALLRRGRIPPGAGLLLPLGLLTLLYILNLGGSHNLQWVAGVRLLVEVIALFAAGIAAPDPRRTAWHLRLALVVVLAVESLYALVQQVLGEETLVYVLGYGYGSQVRSSSVPGMIRTSGTFEDPFQLAALCIITWCVVAFRPGRWLLPVALLAGIGVLIATQVRTVAIQIMVIAILVGLRQRYRFAVALTTVAAVVSGLVAGLFYLESAAEPGRPARPLLLGLNGRSEAWGTAIQSVRSFITGNGVGAFGAGRNRFSGGVLNEVAGYDPNHAPVAVFSGDPGVIDSAYLQILSDVGLLGVLCLLVWIALVGAHLVWFSRVDTEGWSWIAGAVLLTAAVDWIGRSTFASFSTGFLTLYVLGVTCAASWHVVAEPLRGGASRRVDTVR